jgi:hypothetical protein
VRTVSVSPAKRRGSGSPGCSSEPENVIDAIEVGLAQRPDLEAHAGASSAAVAACFVRARRVAACTR